MMDIIEQDTLSFFDGHSSAIPIYRALEQELFQWVKQAYDFSVRKRHGC